MTPAPRPGPVFCGRCQSPCSGLLQRPDELGDEAYRDHDRKRGLLWHSDGNARRRPRLRRQLGKVLSVPQWRADRAALLRAVIRSSSPTQAVGRQQDTRRPRGRRGARGTALTVAETEQLQLPPARRSWPSSTAESTIGDAHHLARREIAFDYPSRPNLA